MLLFQFEGFCQEERTDKLLKEAFSKAAKTFPSDSASLYTLYFQWGATTDIHKKQKQIDRINSLLTESSIKKYRNVEKNLKPLMAKIVANNHINKNQLNEFLMLYCDYDFFSGEALCNNFLTNDENYSLVWKSFDIISGASKNDTIFISAMMVFDDKIRTNIELSEEIMFGFLAKSIENNPEGFLDMYLARKKDTRREFANRILYLNSTELISIFTIISEKSKTEEYKRASSEILSIIKGNKNAQ